MEKIRLAVDVESGDFGPSVLIAGVMEARRQSESALEILLCGERHSIEKVLSDPAYADESLDGIKIEHCQDRIQPDDKRTGAWKTRINSSIIRSVSLQKRKKVHASISAGDTAVLMSAALFLLGRNEGVSRPALSAFLPTVRKRPVLLLDVGANLNCRADHLVSFARMGSEYVRKVNGSEKPIVALLNIGHEQIKGTRVINDASKVLEKKLPGYSGYIEGHQVLSGSVDVVVCDGFVGNVLLKACESFHILASSLFENNTELLSSVKKQLTAFNPENYGAVPFLGIKGTVLKAHGGSSSKAIANAVLTAAAVARKSLEDTMKSKG